MRELPPQEWILIAGNTIFFGLCLCIWIVAKIFPAWDARQVERMKRRQGRSHSTGA